MLDENLAINVRPLSSTSAFGLARFVVGRRLLNVDGPDAVGSRRQQIREFSELGRKFTQAK